MMQLHQKHEDKVVCITASLDYDESDVDAITDEVKTLLQDKKIAVTNLILKEDPIEIQDKFEASIPIVLVYDQDGKLKHTFNNGNPEAEPFTYEDDVIPFVEELLKETE